MTYFSVLGDSISTFEGLIPEGWRLYYDKHFREDTGVIEPSDTWWGHVIDHFGGKLLVDGAFSGSLVEGAGFPAGDSDERVAALAKDGVSPDVILIYIGINDYGWGGARAQAAGRGNARPVCLEGAAEPAPAVAGVASADALSRFAAAYESMLSRVRAAYPQARVWCVTHCAGHSRGCERATFTDNLRGVPLASYNAAIREAARNAGANVADAAAFGLDYQCREDGVHPTVFGMAQLARMVELSIEHEGEIAAEHEAFGVMRGAPGPVTAALAAQVVAETGAYVSDPCTKGRACVGCPEAVFTGNEWICACRRGGESLPAWDALALAGRLADEKLLEEGR